MKTKISRFIAALLIVATLSFATFADTIKLKNGSIIKGRITGFIGGKFIVTIGEGARQRTLEFSAGEVESVEFEQVPAIPATARTNSEDVRVIPSSTPARQTGNPRVVTTDATSANVPASQPRETPVKTTPSQPVPDRITKPVELTVRVLADNTSNGWTNSGWVVKKGQRIRITGEGEVSLGNGKTSNAAGLYDLPDNDKLMQAVPTGALLAVIGDDNNDFIYVGLEREFVASRDGALFLGLNEGNLNDNTGALTVKIEIFPDSTK